jgi:Mlc titration factor MtfA (ptsG expression regulator)
MAPAMARAVEFTDIKDFEAETRRMPNFTLHELAHGYHDRVLPGGFGNPDLKSAHARAKGSGKYDKVERKDAQGRSHTDRAYALVNPMEFFAESTEAFFTRNDFFPFDRTQLHDADPETEKLIGRLWGVPSFTKP